MYKILELNPVLQWHAGDIDLRMNQYHDTKKRLLPNGGTLNEFANGHEYYGFHRVEGGPPLPTSCTWRASSTAGIRPVTL